MSEGLEALLTRAFAARADLLEPRYEVAFRAFHGFTEGAPQLALDVFGTSLVLHDHAGPEGDIEAARLAARVAQETWPWVRAVLWKVRKSPDRAARAGRVIVGEPGDLARRVREGAVRYALALDAGKDASLYLDTRLLRAHLAATSAGAAVLNTFAYTGSLGVAARAAPARHVVHVDASRESLNLAKASYALNGFPVKRGDFLTEDVFALAGRLRRQGTLFDVVIVDPPFFSETSAGRVDLVGGTTRLLDKLRPLVADGGSLVVVNNALFLPGAELHAALESACAGGWAEIESLVPVAEDGSGYPSTVVGAWPADPAPWGHSTKIAILRVKRKDGRKAT